MISIKQHKLGFLFAVLAIVLVAAAINNQIKNGAQSQTEESIPAVKLIAAGDFREQKTVRVEGGTVQSLDQADLKSQISAQITAINVKLGDQVQAGQIIMQLQNSDISAQLEQARARLDELKKGARDEELNLARTANNEAKAALVNSIKDAYAKSDDAIHNHIDKFFTNPRGKNIRFSIILNVGGSQVSFYPSDSDLGQRVADRKYKIEAMLDEWKDLLAGADAAADDADIENILAVSKKNLQEEIDFANEMAPLVNSLSSDNSTYKTIIDGYKTEFSAARSAINGSLASLQGALTARETARQTLELKLAGASPEQLRQAQAAVDALESTLAKTSIVSPISGQISYINGRVGELAGGGSLVAGVVNPGALQIKAYVSENDLREIAEGAAVKIDGGGTGILQTISPAADSQTKKSEINVLIAKPGNAPIIVGQTVGFEIAAKGGADPNAYLLPIEAIQFTANGNYVLTVGAESALERIPVTTGDIVGEKIYVVQGLDGDAKIISSTRGLKSGDIIKVEN